MRNLFVEPVTDAPPIKETVNTLDSDLTQSTFFNGNQTIFRSWWTLKHQSRLIQINTA